MKEIFVGQMDFLTHIQIGLLDGPITIIITSNPMMMVCNVNREFTIGSYFINHGSILGLSEQDCVELRRDFEIPFKFRQITGTSMTSSLYKWNDRGCKEENYFLCERPIADGEE